MGSEEVAGEWTGISIQAGDVCRDARFQDVAVPGRFGVVELVVTDVGGRPVDKVELLVNDGANADGSPIESLGLPIGKGPVRVILPSSDGSRVKLRAPGFTEAEVEVSGNRAVVVLEKLDR